MAIVYAIGALESWFEERAQPGRPMRFRDPATGRDLPSQSEERTARRAAEARAESKAAARHAAEARLAELQALIRERGG